MEQSIRVTLRMELDMAQVPKFGLMEQSTKESGDTTRLMVKENSGMLMAMFMKVFGKMIKLMATEFTFM